MALTLSEDYQLHKLIFVNSGSSAYVELPMSNTGALFGDNNEGKTSGLSALKLFILPETNFKDCERKFGFQSGGTFYRADQSCNYYFPSENSFIVCEAENPKGKFCMVLHKAREEWAYGRIAIATSYDAIKHLFWNFDSDANHGFGAQRESLQLTDTLKALKQLGGKALRTRQEIREAIYNRVGVLDDLSRFCLIPLIQKGEKGSVDALRSLLSLAFDIKGAAKSTLPKALATIIDGENTGSESGMAIEIGAITSEYQQLKQRGDQLAEIENAHSNWQVLSDNVRELKQLKLTLSQQLPVIHHSLKALQQEQLDSESELNTQLEQALSTKRNASEGLQAAENETSEIRNTLKLRRSDLDQLQQKIQASHAVLNTYTEADDLESLQALLAQLIEQCETQVSSLQNQEAAIDELNALNSSIKQQQHTVNTLKQQLSLLLQPSKTTFSGHLATVLFNLNPAFKTLDSEQLSPQALEQLNTFADHFSVEGNKLVFDGLNLNVNVARELDVEQQQSQLDQQIVQAQSQLNLLEKKRSAIQSVLDVDQSETTKNEQLANKQAELSRLQQELKSISHAQFLEQEAEALELTIEQLEPQLNEKQALQSEIAEQFAETQAAFKQVEYQIHGLKPQREALNQQLEQLNRARLTLGLVVTEMPADEEALSKQECEQYLKQYLEKAEQQPLKLSKLREQLAALLNQKLVNVDKSFLYEPELNEELALKAFEALRAVFENLEDNKHHYRNDISAHNHETSIRVSLLARVADTIEQFKAQVNQELSRYQISNLSAVTLDIAIDPRFQSLLTDMESFDFTTNQLASHQFYERLSSFCEDFFQNNTSGRRIQLDKIITGVEYHYVIDGRVEKASQSNGTNCMISTVLLAVLLRRLVPDMINVRVPIVFDEAGSLDAKNLKTIKSVVEDNGFVLFIANPTNNGVIASVIEHWFDLSMYRLSEGTIIGKCSVLHYDMDEGLSLVAEA